MDHPTSPSSSDGGSLHEVIVPQEVSSEAKLPTPDIRLPHADDAPPVHPLPTAETSATELKVPTHGPEVPEPLAEEPEESTKEPAQVELPPVAEEELEAVNDNPPTPDHQTNLSAQAEASVNIAAAGKKAEQLRSGPYETEFILGSDVQEKRTES